MSDQQIDIPLTCEVGAAVDTLLAIEMLVERAYFDRATNPGSMASYNRLGDVVLPLRDAISKALGHV